MKKILLTGCSAGIGRAFTLNLEACGAYEVYGLARHATMSDLSSTSRLHLYDCDLADSQKTAHTLSQIINDAQGFDIAICNAGAGNFKPIDQLSLTEWQQLLTVNLTSAYMITHSVLPYMRQQGSGKLIYISSDADHFSFADASAYCAAKAGLSAMADCVRKEVANTEITVTTISPGRVDTNFNGKQPGDRPHSLQAKDVASQIEFLLH